MLLKQKIKYLIENFCFKWFERTGRFIGSKETFGFIVSNSYHKHSSLLRDYKYDIERYINGATLNGLPNDRTNLIYRIIAHYHVLEKGLTMPEPRLGYGKDIAESLIKHINLYIKMQYKTEDSQFLVAINVLVKYAEFNKDVKEFERIVYDIQALNGVYNKRENKGGHIEVNKSEYLNNCQANFEKLALSRVSIRNFADTEVDLAIIDKAVKIAIKTPSVCNRQAWSTITILNKSIIENVLNQHNGNRGFGHLIKCLIVVKMDLRAFYGSEERNQAFIDSGMFGMSLVYALQHLQLGSVVLNWATHEVQNKEVHRLLSIKDCECVTMLIGVGHLKDNFRVPYSLRKTSQEINQFIN